MKEYLGANPPRFDSNEGFNTWCRNVTAAFKGAQHLAGAQGEEFAARLAAIAKGGEKVIRTPWGGVDIEERNDPHVEKYLVVRAGHYLAYESHELKEEHLDVRAGSAVLILCRKGDRQMSAQVLEQGATVSLNPGDEHCLIALSDLLVFETSEDHKGMDQDLVFRYEPV